MCLFFERCTSFSRINIIWISRTLATNVHKVETLTKTFSDHIPQTFKKKKNDSFKWRLNEKLEEFLSIILTKAQK